MASFRVLKPLLSSMTSSGAMRAAAALSLADNRGRAATQPVNRDIGISQPYAKDLREADKDTVNRRCDKRKRRAHQTGSPPRPIPKPNVLTSISTLLTSDEATPATGSRVATDLVTRFATSLG